MERLTSRRGRGITFASLAVSVALWGSLGHPVHADDEPVAEPPVATGEVDGAVVAVGLPPVPPTTVVVAVGLAPVPPTTVVVTPEQPATPPTSAGHVGDQLQPVLAARASVEVVDVSAVDVVDVVADMVATVEAALALVDSHL